MADQDEAISGGYIILARKIVGSEVWEKPAIWIAIWMHILLKVNWKDKGKLKRGQGFFNWQIEKTLLKGVTRHQWEKAVFWLASSGTIAKLKAQHGIIITVLNYDRYQNPDLYKSGSESEGKAEQKRNRSGTEPENPSNLNEKQTPKKVRRKEGNRGDALDIILPPILDNGKFRTVWAIWKKHRKEKHSKLTDTTISMQIDMLEKMGLDRAVAAINRSITNGWTGIFEERGGAGDAFGAYDKDGNLNIHT